MATTPNNGWDLPDDSDPFKDGALAIRTLGNAIDTSVGTGLLAWQTYAPTLSGGWANGNGVYNEAKYVKIGKTVHMAVRFTLGSTTTKGTTLSISLPLTAANTYGFGMARFTAGGSIYNGVVVAFNAATATLLPNLANATYLQQANVTTTVPGTWVTGDSFIFTLTYEAA
jgi:hypothetical protein